MTFGGGKNTVQVRIVFPFVPGTSIHSLLLGDCRSASPASGVSGGSRNSVCCEKTSFAGNRTITSKIIIKDTDLLSTVSASFCLQDHRSS